MHSFPVVSWRDIQGNKYSRALHPAMLTANGYPVTARTRVIGRSKRGSDYVTINYDRSYVIKWLEVKVIKPLTNCGLLNKLWFNWCNQSAQRILVIFQY